METATLVVRLRSRLTVPCDTAEELLAHYHDPRNNGCQLTLHFPGGDFTVSYSDIDSIDVEG